MSKVTPEEYKHASEMLEKFVKPGSTVYSVLRKSNATTQHVSFFAYHEGHMMLLDGYISKHFHWHKLAKTARGGLILDKHTNPAEVVHELQRVFGGNDAIRHEDL